MQISSIEILIYFWDKKIAAGVAGAAVHFPRLAAAENQGQISRSTARLTEASINKTIKGIIVSGYLNKMNRNNFEIFHFLHIRANPE